jgi:hypothetical protein
VSKHKRKRVNVIGENPSKPALLNEPARIAMLLAAKHQKEEKEEKKKKNKLSRKEKKDARAQQAADQAKEKQLQSLTESPIVDLLFSLGFVPDNKKKPKKSEMEGFMKANNLRCKKSHPSRADIVARLLTRLQIDPPAGGWRRSDAVVIAAGVQSEAIDSEAEEESPNDSTSDEEEHDENSTSVQSNEQPDREPRNRRLIRQRSFRGMVSSAANISA